MKFFLVKLLKFIQIFHVIRPLHKKSRQSLTVSPEIPFDRLSHSFMKKPPRPLLQGPPFPLPHLRAQAIQCVYVIKYSWYVYQYDPVCTIGARSVSILSSHKTLFRCRHVMLDLAHPDEFTDLTGSFQPIGAIHIFEGDNLSVRTPGQNLFYVRQSLQILAFFFHI